MKRYYAEVNCQYGSMYEDPEGDYVKYEDAKELLEALEDLLLDMRMRVRDSETMSRCEKVISKAKDQ